MRGKETRQSQLNTDKDMTTSVGTTCFSLMWPLSGIGYFLKILRKSCTLQQNAIRKTDISLF